MSGEFFRAGVGAVVVDAGRILVLRRKGARDSAWQLPQGGVEAGEDPEAAIYRELREETGLERAQLRLLSSAGEWLAYELPPEYRNAKVGRGQVPRWFLYELAAPRGAVRPDGLEFEDAAWVTAQELLARAVPFRVPLYRRLVDEFGL